MFERDQFPYFLLKYPQSEESETSLTFSSLITEVDNFSNNDNDFIFQNKVKFEYSETKNYNSEIMTLLNKVIEIPEMKVEDISLFENFHQDMEIFFKKI